MATLIDVVVTNYCANNAPDNVHVPIEVNGDPVTHPISCYLTPDSEQDSNHGHLTIYRCRHCGGIYSADPYTRVDMG